MLKNWQITYAFQIIKGLSLNFTSNIKQISELTSIPFEIIRIPLGDGS